MQKNFLDQAEIVMIGMAGDFVQTEHSATKDVVSINYARIYEYMNSNRFNRDFKDEILKRKQLFCRICMSRNLMIKCSRI